MMSQSAGSSLAKKRSGTAWSTCAPVSLTDENPRESSKKTQKA